MKIKKSAVLIMFTMLCGLNCLTAQENFVFTTVSSIEPRPIFITTNKTTNLIFQFAIKSVDRGSLDVLARQVEGVDNILQLKAGKDNLLETNLTVITADGSLYSFLINYKLNPPDLVFKFTTDSTMESAGPDEKRVVRFKGKASSDAEIMLTGAKLLKFKNQLIIGIHNRRARMNFKLRGVYVQNDVLYFRLECKNLSNINYDVDMLRFFIRDQYKTKRTAMQEVEITPYSIIGNHSTIPAHTRETFIVASPKFTIPYAKYLTIAIAEKDGGRNLRLNLSNQTIVEAKAIVH